MAIAFDKVTAGTANVSSYSHTVTGSNTLLFVCVQVLGTVSGVTYNGVAMTQIAVQTNTASGSKAYIFYLANPATGAHTVAISGSFGGFLDSGAVSYSGCSQTGIPDASAVQGDTVTNTYTRSLTTIADNCWLLMATINTIGDGTAGTGTTKRMVSGGGGFNIWDSNGAKSPAGSYSLQASATGATWASIIVSFAPPSVFNSRMFSVF